ncbi:twin-arginine translocase TatA/TatE family subunit [Salinarchaeum laminariae]|uniref:twin-arginine translocase TatA/TatE family subunit n=1 Tax=Salinarchaeum laminariae TaxID=869888 RepID=UPI0020BF0BC5|nr:twin-arginine translocase TatA/TatE family subunit [Salinarchaeum laminariae]
MVATPLFGIPMGPEVIVILLIAILLFGANKIPKLARSTGQAIGEFEKGKTQAEKELEDIRSGDSDVTQVDGDAETSETTETSSSGADDRSSSE